MSNTIAVSTVPAIRVVVEGTVTYAVASRAAYINAVEALGNGSLNLVDCTKRLADGAYLFTYTVITDAHMSATHPRG